MTDNQTIVYDDVECNNNSIVNAYIDLGGRTENETTTNDRELAGKRNYDQILSATYGTLLLRVPSLSHGLTINDNAYIGGLYGITLDRIYFIPYGQSNVDTWHYIDCTTSTIVAYSHSLGANTPVVNAYQGGSYIANLDRLYFSPDEQADVDTWHYINGATGAVVAYSHSLGANTPVDQGYSGSVYSITEERMYLVPFKQSNVDTWHYINGTTGAVVAYSHSLGANTPVVDGYRGGCYAPLENNIWLAPFDQGSIDTWHYIDCDTGTVIAYSHNNPTNAGADAYAGGVYSETLNRIYFCPFDAADNGLAKLHYVDCATNTIVEYSRVFFIFTSDAFFGGAYFPIQDKIIFAPHFIANFWLYIDCSDGSIQEYHKPSPLPQTPSYAGAVYSPNEHRVYFVPYGQADNPTMVVHYINDVSTNITTDTTTASNSTFNNGF